MFCFPKFWFDLISIFFRKKKKTTKKNKMTTENPPLTLGPFLPNKNDCKCLFYFNILGENDPLNVFLVAFTVSDNIEMFILNHKTKQWQNDFTNNHKLRLHSPFDRHFWEFGCAFMVLCSKKKTNKKNYNVTYCIK